MATSGKSVDERTRREIERLRNVVGLSVRETAKAVGVSAPTVQKHARKP